MNLKPADGPLPIEATEHGVLVFLDCGCAGWRALAHPSGQAFLVEITSACKDHQGTRVLSILKGTLVSRFTRMSA